MGSLWTLFFNVTGDLADENTFTKVIHGLNETIGVVLEYLQDAKVGVQEHLHYLPMVRC